MIGEEKSNLANHSQRIVKALNIELKVCVINVIRFRETIRHYLFGIGYILAFHWEMIEKYIDKKIIIIQLIYSNLN